MLSFKRFYIAVIFLLFITFSAIYFSSLNNAHRIYPAVPSNQESTEINDFIKGRPSLFYGTDYNIYKLNLAKDKNAPHDVIEIPEINIRKASLIVKTGSNIKIKNWIKYKPTGEFSLNMRPYFKIDNSISYNEVYLLIAGDTFENLAVKQYDYNTFAKSKSALYLIRIINIMILLGTILSSLYVYLKLRIGYCFFFLFYMLLSFCSSMLYNGFTNDFWPFNNPVFADHALSIGLGVHLVTLNIFIFYYFKDKVFNKSIKVLSTIFLSISIGFLIMSFYLTSYVLLRYEVWFSCVISLVFLFLYPTIFKKYRAKDAYKFNYLSIISYVLLSLIYSIKYFSFFTPNITFELLQKNLFLSHIACLFFAFILINKKKLIKTFVKEERLIEEEALTVSDYEENNSELAQLSDREYKVLELISEGLRDQEIADQLFVSLATVKTHKQRIYRKLNINNKLQAAHIYSEFNSKVINL